MKLHQLRALVAIAEKGSLQDAAQALHVTQPAVTKAIQDLERDLGVTLILRSPQGAQLSVFGKSLVKHARAVEQEIRHAHEDIDNLVGLKKGSVVLGITPVVAMGPISKVVIAFHHRYPDIDLRIAEMRPAQIHEGLLDGTLDLGIVSRIGVPDTSQYHWDTLYDVGIVIGVRAGHPLTNVDSIHDLQDYTWLAWDPFDIPGGMFSEIYKRLNLALPKKIIRCSSTVLYTQLATETDCICMLTTPALEWAGFKDRLKLLSLKESLPTMQIGLVYRNESLVTQIATEFHGFVKNICKEMKP